MAKNITSSEKIYIFKKLYQILLIFFFNQKSTIQLISKWKGEEFYLTWVCTILTIRWTPVIVAAGFSQLKTGTKVPTIARMIAGVLDEI